MGKVFLATGADHRGAAKLAALTPLLEQAFPELELAPQTQENHPGDNYNAPASRVAEAVLAREAATRPRGRSQKAAPRQVFGLLICGSGHGMCMQANRYLGIRAINAPDPESAAEGREHSDANVLCLAGERLSVEEMLAITRTFLTTQLLDEARYQERIRLLDLPQLLETEVLPELSSFAILPGAKTPTTEETP